MNKQEFLNELRSRLNGIPQDDIEERIAFYSEMIDDRVEEGLMEEQAIAQLGTLDAIIKQIMSDVPLTTLLKEKVKLNRVLRTWEIILLILGSPIWLSILLTLCAVILSVYVVLWSVIVSLWALDVSFLACSLGAVVSAVAFVIGGNVWSGVMMLGLGLFCTGLAILCFFFCKYATVVVSKLTKQMYIWIKSWFIRKEARR